MGISLAPDAAAPDPTVDPLKKKPAAPAAAAAPAATPSLSLAPQSPGQAGGIPSIAAAPMTPPTPTVAAPSAPVDRVKLATDIFNQSAASTQGAYDAASRDNVHNSAALGQIASGGLRTREGNLQLARGRDLDTLRQKLVNDATTGSIADATTAYQQGLASSQQGLAEKIGLAGIENQQGSLDLEKQKFATGTDQSQQQIDLAKQAQAQNFGLETEKVGIAKGAQDIANQVALGQLSIAQATSALDEKVRTGQLTIAERNEALAELSQSQSQGNETQRIQLAKDQLTQQGEQFGLSLAQTKELATLADQTANRQIDVTSAQGQNTLLLELARIMGAKDLSSIPPDFLAAIAKALGVAMPAGTTGTPTTGISPTGIKPTDPTNTGDVNTGDTKIPGTS